MTEKQRFEIVKRLLPRLKYGEDVVKEAQRIVDWVEGENQRITLDYQFPPVYHHVKACGITPDEGPSITFNDSIH